MKDTIGFEINLAFEFFINYRFDVLFMRFSHFTVAERQAIKVDIKQCTVVFKFTVECHYSSRTKFILLVPLSFRICVNIIGSFGKDICIFFPMAGRWAFTVPYLNIDKKENSV